MEKIFEVIDNNDFVFYSIILLVSLIMLILMGVKKKKIIWLTCPKCHAKINFLTWSLFSEKSICQDCANGEWIEIKKKGGYTMPDYASFEEAFKAYRKQCVETISDPDYEGLRVVNGKYYNGEMIDLNLVKHIFDTGVLVALRVVSEYNLREKRISLEQFLYKLRVSEGL